MHAPHPAASLASSTSATSSPSRSRCSLAKVTSSTTRSRGTRRGGGELPREPRAIHATLRTANFSVPYGAIIGTPRSCAPQQGQ